MRVYEAAISFQMVAHYLAETCSTSPRGQDIHDKGSRNRRPRHPRTELGAVMQERLSDFVISLALFVVAAFWVWKHMKTGATTRPSLHCGAPKYLCEPELMAKGK